MKRDSFIFYRSFLEALEELSDEQYARVFRAISKFALDGKETKLSGVEKAIFQLAKPQLIANQKRWENGCKGGRKPSENKPSDNQDDNQNGNQKETETKPSDNQSESKPEPNENENENVLKVSKKERKEKNNLNKNNNVRESYDEIISDFEFTLPVENKVRSFLQYCHLNGQKLTNDQLDGILVELDLRYDDDESKIKALDDSMRGGYYALRR